MSELVYANPEIAEHYAKSRPSPPDNLAKVIIDYLKETQGEGETILKLCVDVGCGSGQNTKLYVDHFQQVIGIDVSPDQLAVARSNNTYPNVVYKEASAELLPFEDASVDLITCCQAVHWFNIDAFFAEVRRVLRPGGVLACCGCQDPALLCNGEDLSYIIDELMVSWEVDKFDCYSHVFNEYTKLPDLYQEHVMIRAAEGRFRVEWEDTVDMFMARILSFPPYQSARNKYGQQKIDQDMNSAKQRLQEAMGSKNKQQKMKVQHNYFVRMWRKPYC